MNAFLWRGVASLAYQKPAGRPPKLTKTQRKELAALIKAGPEAAGYTTACWAVLIQDLVLRIFELNIIPTTSVRCWTKWGFVSEGALLFRTT